MNPQKMVGGHWAFVTLPHRHRVWQQQSSTLKDGRRGTNVYCFLMGRHSSCCEKIDVESVGDVSWNWDSCWHSKISILFANARKAPKPWNPMLSSTWMWWNFGELVFSALGALCIRYERLDGLVWSSGSWCATWCLDGEQPIRLMRSTSFSSQSPQSVLGRNSCC